MKSKTCAVNVGIKDLRFVKQVGADIEFHYRDGVVLILTYWTRKEALSAYIDTYFFKEGLIGFRESGLANVEVKTQEER